MTDDEIYDFITELYESNSHLKVGYLTSYTLTALERDIANGEHDASKLNLKKVPSKSIIKIETDKKRAKNKRKNKASRKGKAKRAEAEKEEGKIEDFSDDDEERQAEDRPECLFYRLWKFILHDWAGVKYFLHLVCVYMINRVFTDKAFLDQDDYGADDNNNVQNEASMLKRRDGILAFVDDLFKKFREDTLDVPDPSQRKFEMPKINSRIYNAYEFKKSSKNKEEIKGEDNKEAYEATMPYEMIYFIQKIVEILKLRYPNESKGYIMYSKVLELFFEDIMDILRDFKIQLTPYVRDMDSFRKIKADLQKFHLYNLENIFEVFISTIGYRDPFEKVDYHPYKDLFEEVKSSLKREARSRIDDLYFNFVDKIKGYKPELDLFKKLVVHSFDHKGVKINVSIDKFIKFHYLWVKSPKLIFGREESDFDFVSSTLSKIKHIVYYENIKEKSHKIQIELKTNMFAEPFQTVKRCTDCNACFTTKYSQPVHKTLISGFIPSDLSSLHSVYTTVLRSPESESGGFNSMNELLLDAEAQPVNHANPQAETIRKGKLKIVETIDKKWEENGGKDGITRSEFSDKIHSENYDRIENEISKRNQHLTYLRVVFQNLIDLESEIEYYKKDFHVALKSDKLAKSNSNQYPISFTNLKLAYDNLFKNYRFGWANRKLESFASINKQMKYANQIFKKSNKSIASKELFENLTNDQKRDLKSFHRMRFTKLLRDGTIVNLNRMPELESIKNNLGVTFFEDQNYNIQGQVIFKDRPKTAMCGAAIKNTKSSILLKFTIKQEEILSIMKKDPNKSVLYGDVLEFNVGKLSTIISNLFRVRAGN